MMQETEVEAEPHVVSRGGALLANFRPCFSSDGKSIFCCCGYDVNVYSVITGKCVCVLRGHTDFVTGVQNHPNNHLQVFTSSLDRTIASWDYMDGVRLKLFRVGFPVETFLLTTDYEDRLTFYCVCQEATKKFTVQRVTPPPDSRTDVVECQPILESVSAGHNSLAVGRANRFVAAIEGIHLIVYKTKKNSVTRHHTNNRRRLTCVTAHPGEDLIATGCADGAIALWRNFMGHQAPVSTSLHHWHALPVLALCFSQEGSYLLSGGHECVLVVWQDQMQHKDFLPRLGAPIGHVNVSRDNTHYVTAHYDNMIQVISNNLKVRQIIQGLTRSFKSDSTLSFHKQKKLKKEAKNSQQVDKEISTIHFPRTGLHLDQRSNAMVLNGRSGHLQFYHIQRDQLMYNLDIVGQNYVSSDSLHESLVMTEIDACALSADADWLATAQSRDDGVYSVDVCLKFWKFDEIVQSYSLNTAIDLPHRCPVTSLLFRPAVTDHMCVTTSHDGKFKLWSIRDDSDIYRESTCWDCESVGFYRDRPAALAEFSQDGSLLAVAFHDVITLWNPDTNGLRTTLESRDLVTQLKMGYNDCKHLLVACTKNLLIVWNVLSLSVQWVAETRVVTLARDPTSSNMAAFTDHRELFVFSPSKSQPVFTLANVSRHDVTAAIFVPQSSSAVAASRHQWMARARLYFMDTDQKMLTISDGEQQQKKLVDTIDQTLPQSVLSLTLSQGQSRSDLSQGQSRSDLSQEKLQAKPQPAYKIFDAPAHTMPPVSTLGKPFLHSLLTSRHGRPDKNDDDDVDDSESDVMDDDDDSDESDADRPTRKPARESSKQMDTTTVQTDNVNKTLLRQMNELKFVDCAWLKNILEDDE